MKVNELYKRAIVTGGAGFIGSHLCQKLIEQGLQVISVDDYCAGKEINHAEFINHKNFTAVNCDITNINKLEPIFDGVDIVFHQAASKNTVCMNNPSRDLEVNAKGTLNVLELSRKYNVKKIIHVSTGSVYGDAQYFPTDEKHPVNPNSYYGVSKLAGEKYARLFTHLYDMDITMLRYFHVYGPRQDYSDVGGVISIFGRKAFNKKPLLIYGDGTQLRSFTYVKDVVDINLLAATNPKTKGQVYNCASGIKVTVQELAEKVRQYFKLPDLPIEYDNWKMGDVKVFDVDNTAIKKLGFKFSYDFDNGLSHTLEWVKHHLSELTETN